MKKYKGYLIDLDGTMYRGTEKIKEAMDFVKVLEEKNIPYLYVTNNSSRTPEQVAEKLQNMGIPTSPSKVFTASMATATYIHQRKKGAKVLVIGEDGIRTALGEKGFVFCDENLDFVVMGIDREISYEKLAKACLAVRSGAVFISTNGDVALPTERGLLLGNGAITSAVAVSTGVQPIFIGKPEQTIMEQAVEILGVAKEDTIMVGDNYETDILAGIAFGMDTLLVHTGVTTPEHLAHVEVQPTYAVSSLGEWLERI